MRRVHAAYVGQGFALTHPIRMVVNRGLHENVARMLSITEALELVSDLTSAVARALEQEHKQSSPRTDENCPTEPRAGADAVPPSR